MEIGRESPIFCFISHIFVTDRNPENGLKIINKKTKADNICRNLLLGFLL